ncbi:MAG: hypothetical protein PHP93_04555 [Kiritimatiellales bacterium]|nr:hypothetical protein [Kiritimatiellales bacterium]
MATGDACGTVDERDRTTYYRTVMKLLIFRYLALVITLAASSVPVAAEDLDAALAAQKKKAQHRIYSERAVLESRNLTVPQAETKEERSLNKKIREIDARADAIGPSPQALVARPIPALPSRTEENANWLTPAVLDSSVSAEIPVDKDNWLANEIERQKTLKEQVTVDKLLDEKKQQQSTLLELDRGKQHQLPQQNSGAANPSPAAPLYILPESNVSRTPPPSFLTTSKRESVSPPLFSFQTAGNSSTPNQDSVQKDTWPGSPFFKPSSGLTSESKPEESAKLSPLQMIKKSSPIHKADPFAEDNMPQFKSSIWD